MLHLKGVYIIKSNKTTKRKSFKLVQKHSIYSTKSPESTESPKISDSPENTQIQEV